MSYSLLKTLHVVGAIHFVGNITVTGIVAPVLPLVNVVLMVFKPL